MVREKYDARNDVWTDEDFKCLVFCNSKKDCARLCRTFEGWKIPANALHGAMDQYQRDNSLRMLKSGKAKLLFATDVASRGLDIKGVTAVVNYSPSQSKEDHTHRIGRTGRAGNKGTAITYFLPEEKYRVPDIVHTMKKRARRYRTR